MQRGEQVSINPTGLQPEAIMSSDKSGADYNVNAMTLAWIFADAIAVSRLPYSTWPNILDQQKNSILKVYQQGGGLIYTPFIPEQYADSSGRSSRSSSGSDDDEDAKLDPLDKELLGLMKDQNLLPSDIQMIYNKLIAFQRSTQRLSSMEGFGGTGSYRSVMPGMLQIMNLVSQARYNKGRADSAITRMTNENTGSDVALDKYGRMYVQNMDGKVEKIKPSDYNVEKYRPISNSELMYLREQSLPFDSDILSDVAETVGMTSISKEIDRIINEFGKTKTEGYFDKNTSDIFNALASKSPDGIYKITEEKSSADLRKAWNIIFKQLPTNMQHVLNARAALSDSDPANFIHEIVLSNLDYTFGINYDEQQSKAAGFDTDPNKTASDQLTQNNFLQMVGNLRGSKTLVSIAPRAAKINERAAITAPAYTWGRVIDRNKEPIRTQSLADALKNGWGFAAGDPQTVVFGNKLLKNWELSAVMFDEQSNFTAVMLPYTIDKGHYVPNFELLDKFNQLQEIIDNNPYISRTELQAQIDKLQLNINDIYNFETNTFELQNTMPFISVSGIASDDILNLTDANKKYLERLEKDDGRHLKDYYNNMVKYGKLHPEKKAVEIGGYPSAGKRSFWEGNVFIPMQSDFYAMALSGIGEYVPKTDMTKYVERAAAREIERNNQYRARAANPNWETIGQF